jgi:hypothetical protein
VVVSRATAQTLNLSGATTLQTLGYAAGGDGGGATFVNVGTAPFKDASILTGTVTTTGMSCTNGTYSGVQFNGGTTGTGFTPTVTISGSTVTIAFSGTNGQGFAPGDVLTPSSSASGGAAAVTCTTPFTYTVNTVSTPLGSFSDSVGNHFQIQMPGVGIDARAFGYKPDWTFAGGDAGATDNFNPLQAVLMFAGSWSKSIPDQGGTMGGRVLLPKFAGMFCGGAGTPLIIPGGVRLTGQGKYNSVIKPCDSWSHTVNIVELCDPTWNYACFDAGMEHMQIYMTFSQDNNTSTTASVIETVNDQDTVLLDDVKIYPGMCRRGIYLHQGYGGSTYNTIRQLEFAGGGSAVTEGCAGNPFFLIQYGSTQVRLEDISGGGFSPSFGPRDNGMLITGGFVRISGWHVEQITHQILVNIPGGLANGMVWLDSGIGGSGCNEMVQLVSGNTQGNFTIAPPDAVNGCTRLVTNGQSGGSNLTGPVLQSTIFNP